MWEMFLKEATSFTIYDWGQTLAGFIFAVFYIPQIIALWKNQTTKNLSIGGWAMLNIALLLMWINSLHLFLTLNVVSYFLAECINLAFALVYLVEVIYIRYVKEK